MLVGASGGGAGGYLLGSTSRENNRTLNQILLSSTGFVWGGVIGLLTPRFLFGAGLFIAPGLVITSLGKALTKK